MKNQKKSVKKVNKKEASYYGLDHDFVLIVGGGFIVIVLIMLVIFR